MTERTLQILDSEFADDPTCHGSSNELLLATKKEGTERQDGTMSGLREFIAGVEEWGRREQAAKRESSIPMETKILIK